VTDDSSQDDRTTAHFADLDSYAALPRLGGLWLSPDGTRLVVGTSTADLAKNRFTTALWEVDPAGERAARRLTRGAKSESGGAFTPSGDLLFVSARPEPGAEEKDDAPTALWLQPSGGGDARVVANPPGGVRGVVVAADGTVAFASGVLPSATDLAADKELRAKRTDAKVTAILHEEYPIRYWDHDLGPQRARLLAAALSDEVTGGDATLEPRDVTGNVGGALHDDASWEITPDGRTVVAEWAISEPGGSWRLALVAIDVATGERRVLADDPEYEYSEPRLSSDGTKVAVVAELRADTSDAGDVWLAVVPVAGGPVEHLTRAWDRWPHGARWTPDGTGIVVAADDHGRSPLWLIDAAAGEPTRLTADDGTYSDARVSPDGRWVYALRASVDHPPAPVRVPLDGSGGHEELPGPAEALGQVATVPGRLEEVHTTAEDGTPLRAWLALPADASAEKPAPTLLWIHGGPLGSWNTWQWRWNPWLAVSRGYAVLLPDPALSTGYGIEMVRRGWGQWGGTPYTDLMSITDAALERADLDAGRTAAMGGSFGGYMANWVAGHTDRFSAIVTHASLWALDQMGPTTDSAWYFQRELSPEMAEANSPHRFADAITTPMLVIHGDKDYRVPIGEALRLWWDLSARSKADSGTGPHKFLYFPTENHWVLTPNHAKVWYSTVLAFLDHHVLGKDWQRPELLG
jgi:dipeptidyl aminopeptidase/acylaminoacyl peptidase